MKERGWMKGKIQELAIGGRLCALYLPAGYSEDGMRYPVVYVNGGDEIKIPEIISGIEPHFGMDVKPFLLLAVPAESWNREYSPWPAPELFKKSDPFSGGAEEYLRFLTQTVKPYVDTHFQTRPEPENTAILGYSLGGLASLYALYISNTFGMAGSISGSLWFDGWPEFMGSNRPLDLDSRVYLSLGKGEEHSRNPRMAKVGDCTRKAAGLLESQLLTRENVLLEWNDGGHFSEIPERHQRALRWLMKERTPKAAEA